MYRFTAILVLLLFPYLVSAQTPSANQSIKLRLEPSEIINGVPDKISFVFSNISNHEVRIPFVSPCRAGTSGVLILNLNFSPAVPQTSGKGGDCGAGSSHPPSILEQVKMWRTLQPGESLSLSYTRSELFVFEEAPGDYEFWGEYHPPKLTAEQFAALRDAGMDFAREPLTSSLAVQTREIGDVKSP